MRLDYRRNNTRFGPDNIRELYQDREVCSVNLGGLDCVTFVEIACNGPGTLLTASLAALNRARMPLPTASKNGTSWLD